MVSITLRQRTELKGSIERLFKKEGKGLFQINYVFCSDTKLRSINRQYLNHNYFTDIITFDLSETKNEIIGEIYISVDRVRDNAQHHKTTFSKEILRVIYHGALHLCGYDDKNPKDEKVMRMMEDRLIREFKQA